MKTIDLLVPQPELGKTARAIREERGLTVIDVATRWGVSRQTIYNFENGERQSMELLQNYLRLSEEGKI